MVEVDEAIFLATFVRQYYSESLSTWRRLHSDYGNHIYQLNLEDGQRWVLRVFSADDQSVFSLARMLAFLAEQSYQAEQIVHTIHNDAIVSYEDKLLLVTRFIEGVPVDYSDSALHLLGETLGKLHALRVEDMSILPKAEMLPAPELAYAWSELSKVADNVPIVLQQHYNVLAQAIHTLNRCKNAPLVIIHNDCHPANAIRTSSNEVVLIDWLGAGLGPAVIDVGFLLASCEIPFHELLPIDPDKKRLPTIIDGYCQYHTLTPLELNVLPDSIRFRALVYGAVSFALAISRHQAKPYDSERWWLRYTHADEIADRARACFERYI